MTQRWRSVTFLHWPFHSEEVQALLPDGLTVEPYDGRAWVGLVPFRMSIGPGPVSSVPWVGRFLETNVRTYVRDLEGRPGVWFFSLDAQRLAAVVAARATYSLPYFWSDMALTHDGDLLTYRCHRRWPGPGPAHSTVTIEVGPPYQEVSELDHFLTARWTLFSAGRWGLRYAQVAHEPWPLRRAVVREVHDDLVRRSGLPSPQGDPVVHYSDGVEVKAGPPRRAR